jgi:hypothetical protein
VKRENREHQCGSQQNHAQHSSHNWSPFLCINQALRAIRRRSRRTGFDIRQTIALQESRISGRFTTHDSRFCLDVEHHTPVLGIEVAATLRTWPAGRRGNTGWAGRNAPGRVRSRRS